MTVPLAVAPVPSTSVPPRTTAFATVTFSTVTVPVETMRPASVPSPSVSTCALPVPSVPAMVSDEPLSRLIAGRPASRLIGPVTSIVQAVSGAASAPPASIAVIALSRSVPSATVNVVWIAISMLPILPASRKASHPGLLPHHSHPGPTPPNGGSASTSPPPSMEEPVGELAGRFAQQISYLEPGTEKA